MRVVATGLLLATMLLAAPSCTPPPQPSSDWPWFLGPGRDGKSDDAIVRSWGVGGPPILWQRQVGEGFAAPVVAGGKLVLFHRVDDQEVVQVLDAHTGEDLWQRGYPTTYRDDFGFDEGPRAAPAIVDGVVYTCGAQGVVQAAALDDGRVLWSFDAREQLRPSKGPFGAGCSLLVAAGKVMFNAGGEGETGIVALDAASGNIAWTATDHDAGYSSPVLAELGGTRRALFLTRFGLVDLDPQDGAVRAVRRWHSRSRVSVNAASPVVIGERVFLSAAYGAGAALFEVTRRGFRSVWESDEVLSNHYATSIHHEGTLYGYHGRQPSIPDLRAVDLETGTVLWSEVRLGAGTLLLARDTLIVLREGGELIFADADRERFAPHARAHILEEYVRAYPALAGGILFARNADTLIAVDLRPR